MLPYPLKDTHEPKLENPSNSEENHAYRFGNWNGGGILLRVGFRNYLKSKKFFLQEEEEMTCRAATFPWTDNEKTRKLQHRIGDSRIPLFLLVAYRSRGSEFLFLC